MSTPAVEPHARPSGRSPQFAITVAVGFGRPSPVIVLPWTGPVAVWAAPAPAPSTSAPQTNNVHIRRLDDDMASLPSRLAFR